MKNKPILLVEDNPDDELLTLRALKKHHIANEVVVAHDGEEAIDLLFGGEESKSPQTANSRFALVLLDLKIPKLNGIEVLRRIRANIRTKMLPVVMLTSSKEDRDLVDSYASGVNSYVQKPVDFLEFVKAVEQIGSYWLILNESPTH